MTSNEHDVVIPVDYSDTDSAYGGGSDVASITTSLTSSVFDYHYENGRRYNAYRAGQYWGPNDEEQLSQLDLSHHISLLMQRGRLFLAPLGDSPQRALDVGTGTGIWAIDFADMFPNCQVLGTDLSPTQPREVPPNLQFEVDDACSEWIYTKNSFDFIYIRSLYGSVSDWPKMYDEVFAHLKPGGYVEQMEIKVVPTSDDGTVPPESIFARWGEISLAAGDAFGKTLRCADESRQGLINAGFEGVVEHRFKLPMGDWPREERLKIIGAYNKAHWESGMEGWCMFLLTNYLGWSREEVLVYVAEMRRMLRDKRVHAYHECSVVYGRKPMSAGFGA